MTDRSLGNQQGFLKPFWDGLSFCCCCLTTEHDRSPSLSKQVKFHAAGYPVGFLGDQDEPMPPSSWDRAGRVDYPTELAGPGAGTLHAGCWLAVSWCFLLCSVAVPAGERAVAPQTDAEKELNSAELNSCNKLSLQKPRKEVGLPHPTLVTCFLLWDLAMRFSFNFHPGYHW